MDILTNKYKRNGNAMVASVYSGVSHGGGTVTVIKKPSADHNHMETTRIYTPGQLARGEGGRIGVLVLGGMVTTLDEMEYIIAAKQEKKFVPQRGPAEIAQMCRLVTERRNEQIRARNKYLDGNPSEAPKKKRTVRLHLPVGFRYMATSEPGLKMLARI